MKIHGCVAIAALLGAMSPSSPGHAQAVTATPYYYVVQSGRSLRVANYAALNPNCSIVGPTTVDLVEAPRGGQVSVGEERLYPNFVLANPRSVCDRRRVPQTAIFYQSAPGFVGADRFTVEILFPGNIAKTVRFTINVRPG